MVKVVIRSTVAGGSRNSNMGDVGGRSYMGQKTGQKSFGNRRKQLGQILDTRRKCFV